ncbi:MAG TPA: CYTH domain-containing protein [Patescibacteria group bacterium]|nr:CYTH domain-containing protein [Patescibacteria group bacterium]
MIEVEKKFAWSKEAETSILRDAVFVKAKQFTDTYFDTAEFSLTSKDIWLRKRDTRWEIKIPLHDLHRTDRTSTHYRELESEEEIRSFLKLVPNGTFDEDLARAGYVPCCEITTSRRSYQSGLFKIDFDEASAADGFAYRLFEIELGVEDPAEMASATERIHAFAQAHGLGMGMVHGKILAYLKQKQPKQFAALIASGVAEDFHQ